jgi:flagellar basal-body rod protein FlgC
LDTLTAALQIAGSGMSAQSQRLRVVAENIANAQSTASIAGGDPYQRKTINFADVLDRSAGISFVKVGSIGKDQQPFPTQFDPGNIAADEKGYVKLPNVNMLIEMADMREANRSYDANVQIIKQVRDLVSMTIDLMRASS